MRKLGRLLFSRYAISAGMIVLEVLLIVYLFLSAFTHWYIALGLTVIINIIALVDIINKDANPEYKITWAVVVLVLPLVGTILYVMFYRRRMTRREAMLLASSFSLLNKYRNCDEAFDSIVAASAGASGKARAIMNEDPISEIYKNTTSKFFPTGEEYFTDLIADLKKAENYIFLEYYIIEDGKLWGEIHKILKEKAAAGVDVRLMYDDLGCMNTLPNRYEYTLRREGIRAYCFGKVSPRLSSVHNNRDHRKICVIDGRVGYTGGVNMADEYINEIVRFGHWKDGGIRVEGHAALGFLKLFITMWDFTEGSVSNYISLFDFKAPKTEGDGGYYIPLSSGPAPTYPACVGENAILNLINQSKNYIYITTPYLIIDYALTEALKNAARRGVEVIIVTPGKADKKLVKLMTKSFYPQLVSSGVKIYEYAPGFMHEKLIVSDDIYAMIGTINMDYRSLVHHYEDALWMYKSPTVLKIKEEFLKTLSVCVQINEKNAKLSFSQKVTKDLIRIFAPLL